MNGPCLAVEVFELRNQILGLFDSFPQPGERKASVEPKFSIRPEHVLTRRDSLRIL